MPNWGADMDTRLDQQGEYSLRDVLTVLFRHQRAMILVWVSIVGCVGLWNVLAPPVYEVTAAILVKNSRGAIPLTPSAAPQVVSNQVREEDLNSEIEILRSRHLIETTLDTLKVDESWRPQSFLAGLSLAGAGFTTTDRLSYVDEMVLHLLKEIDIQPVRRSNVVEIAYRSQDGEFATQVLRTLLDHYLEYRGGVFQPPQAVSFFEEETQAAEERLLRAEARLQQYINVAGISIPFEPQKAELLQTLGQFERELAEARVTLQQSEGTAEALEARIGSEPQRLPSANRDNLDPTTEQLRAGLVVLQLRRDELTQEFGPKNRIVRDLDTQMRLAEVRLGDAEARLGGLNRTELNSVHQDLRSRWLQEDSDAKGGLARYASLRERVSEFRTALATLNEKGFEFDRLQRDATSAEEEYLLYRQKHEEARISTAMNQQQMVDVSVVREPIRPLRPVGPRKALNLALALLAGSVAALGVAFGREFVDHSITTPANLERRLGLRSLASIPEVDTP